jgi:hypothetical protein
VIAAVLGLSDAGWGFLGIAITQLVIFAALFVRSGRTGREVSQINRAVNHQPDGSPTLVERVGRIEDETIAHRRWEHEAFSAIATEIGVTLPDHPKETQ